MAELERLLRFAQQIAHEAGRLTVGYFDRSLDIIEKADGSPVTVADRAAEDLIRQAIERTFPDHGIHGEEHGLKAAKSAYTWFIDPIDGTKSFIHGMPLYTTLLGLRRDDEVVVGIIEIPAMGQQMAAAAGYGCRLNGVPVRVSQVSELSKAVGLATDERSLSRYFPDRRFQPLLDGAKFTRTWGDAYGYMMVACGRAEFMLDGKVEPYDVAPLPVIFREAGGKFFDWDGGTGIFGGTGAACNAALEPLLKQHLVR